MAESETVRKRKDLIRNLPKPNFIRLKVISMGESEVGKSCLIKRYCEERVGFRNDDLTNSVRPKVFGNDWRRFWCKEGND